MNIHKIQNKIPVENQYDIELHGCQDDCLEYFGSTPFQVRLIESQGVNATDPSGSDISRGVKVARDLGLSYCYRMHTPVTSIYF